MKVNRTLIVLLVLACGWGAWFEATAQRQLKKNPDRTLTGPGGAPNLPTQLPSDSRNSNRNRPAADTSGLNRDGRSGDPSKGGEEGGEPRLLETSLFNDSIKRQRIFTWRHNRYLNTLHLMPMDTAINDRFRDYPFLRRDVGATYLGTIGSPVVLHNYFKRQTDPSFYYFSPYLEYATTPDNMQFYNTKKAFTRLEYSGTLFSNSIFEEGNVNMFITANLLPQWNGSIRYRHFGTRGLLVNEATSNSELTFGTSYSGKRYRAHAGFVGSWWDNKENGGIVDDFFIRDTTMDARTIDVALASASTKINHYAFFLTQTYDVPLRLFRKDTTRSEEEDSDGGTMISFGHAVEYTTLTRSYSDRIELTDSVGRNYYGGRFFIHPVTSRDSMRMSLFDNRLFFSFQPWAADAIVSKLASGAGFSHRSNYAFSPLFYLSPTENRTQNNLYLYGSASGLFKRYFHWSAFARYDLTGEYHTQHDFSLNGTVGLSLYPLKGGVHFTGRLLYQLKQPDYFLQQTYSNHFVWDNDFNKTNELRAGLTLAIPDWRLEATFDYALLSDAVLFDRDARPVQEPAALHVLAGMLQQNFKVGLFHFDHRILLQTTLNDDAERLPLPTLSANLTYYIQGTLVRNVLTAQLGFDVYYHTRYRAYAYNPAAGAFHTQNTTYIGNYPYIDAFLNMKWKHATIFAKMVNGAEGWLDKEYFAALHYIRPQTVLKLGISWFFF
jgi:hypothetical protein